MGFRPIGFIIFAHIYVRGNFYSKISMLLQAMLTLEVNLRMLGGTFGVGRR